MAILMKCVQIMGEPIKRLTGEAAQQKNLPIPTMLNGNTDAAWPPLATLACAIKFTPASGGCFFVLCGGLANLYCTAFR